MKPRSRASIFLFCAAILASCSINASIQSRPLSDTESALVGTWVYNGVSLTHTYTFNHDRTAQESMSSSMAGNTLDSYLWVADGSTITLYTPDSVFMDPQEVDSYTLSSPSLMTLEGETYQKQ